MGKYSKMLSGRGKHTKIVSGYCVICGRHGSLSKDHVLPQGSIAVTKVEQFHLTAVIGLDRDPVQGIPSMNGSKFRTICRECNTTALNGRFIGNSVQAQPSELAQDRCSRTSFASDVCAAPPLTYRPNGHRRPWGNEARSD